MTQQTCCSSHTLWLIFWLNSLVWAHGLVCRCSSCPVSSFSFSKVCTRCVYTWLWQNVLASEGYPWHQYQSNKYWHMLIDNSISSWVSLYSCFSPFYIDLPFATACPVDFKLQPQTQRQLPYRDGLNSS